MSEQSGHGDEAAPDRPTPPPPAPGYGQYGQHGAPVPPAAPEYGQYGQYGAPNQPPPGQYGVPNQPPPGQYGPVPPDTGGQYGQYGQYGAPAAGYYGGGFVPVPAAFQPGIIPLRPLTLGEIYDGAFRAIRTNPKVMFGLAVLVIGATAILQGVFSWLFLSQFERALASGVDDFGSMFALTPVLGVVLTSVGSGLATLVLEGLAIVSVSESVIGRSISIREVWARAKGRLWRLLGLAVVLWLAALIAFLAVVLVVALLVGGLIQVAGDGALALILLIPLFFVVALIIFVVVWVRVMLATCVVMLERTGIFASIGRSWRLTKGHFWRLLGIMLLTMIIVGILASVLSVPFSMVGAVFAAESVGWSVLLSSLGQLAGSALSIPVLAAVLALLYIDVRMRSEGLDVELARVSQGS